MRIYDRDLTGTTSAETGRSQETQRADRDTTAVSTQSNSSAGDRVELSNGLASVSRALATHGSNRGQKIQQLTAQVQSGTYNPSSMAISQSMVAQALGGAH